MSTDTTTSAWGYSPEPQNPAQPTAQDVLGMSDEEVRQRMHKTAQLDAIGNAWGYGPEWQNHTPPEVRAAMLTRQVIATAKGGNRA